MISLGIDIGSQFLRIVILRDQEIIAKHLSRFGNEAFENSISANFSETLKRANLIRADIECIAATGIGREYVTFADYQLTESHCSARGVHWLSPETDVLIDMGTEKIMVVRIDHGKPVQIVMNERCASGTGRFLAIAAKPLNLSPEELGELAKNSRQDIAISSNCAVFAESEIISLIHRNIAAEDIAKAIFISMAEKTHSLLIKIEPIKNLMMIGWLANNKELVTAVTKVTGFNISTPQSLDAQFVTALGAALAGYDEHKKKMKR